MANTSEEECKEYVHAMKLDLEYSKAKRSREDIIEGNYEEGGPLVILYHTDDSIPFEELRSRFLLHRENLGWRFTTSVISSQDPSVLKRILKIEDLGDQIMLPEDLFTPEVLEFYDPNQIKDVSIKLEDGRCEDVYDQDKNAHLMLNLKNQGGYYTLNSYWNKTFVINRNLEEGDLIAFVWDSSNSQFTFSVLETAWERNQEQKPALILLQLPTMSTSFQEQKVKLLNDRAKKKFASTTRIVDPKDEGLMIKKLLNSDVQGPLKLGTGFLSKYVCSEMWKYIIECIFDGWVKIYDQDTDSIHNLRLREPYYLIDETNWRQHFVLRRTLSQGDFIGLYWDQSNGQFTFSLLKQG